MNKYFLIVLATVVFALPSLAQTSDAATQSPPEHKSILKSLNPTFGIIDMGYSHTELFGETLPGFQMSISGVFNDWLMTGLYFHIASTSRLTMGDPNVNIVNPRYDYFFVGLNNGILLFSKSVVNFSIPLRIGVGGVTLTDRYYQGLNSNARVGQDYFLMMEPGLDMHINLFEHLGLTTGVSYRFAYGVDNAGVNADFNQLFFNVGLRIKLF